MKVFLSILSSVVFIVFILSLAFGAEWLGIKWKGYFGPKHENVRRQVFKNTRSFNEAKAQQLSRMHLEYIREKDPQAREALATVIRQRFADYDESKLVRPELRRFLQQIMRGDTVRPLP